MPAPGGEAPPSPAADDGGGPGILRRAELPAAAGRDFLIKEMDLLQSVFNKYEEWIFRSRTGLVIGLGALMSQLGTKHEADAAIIALILPILAWLVEGGIRWEHWYGFVQRHYAIRAFLNDTDGGAAISLYDLQNQLMPLPPDYRRRKFRGCFLKGGVVGFYGVLWLLAGLAFDVPEKVVQMF